MVFEKRIIVDFYDVISITSGRLIDLGYPNMIDFADLLEHELDVLILGSLYEKFTNDQFKECLSDYRIPSNIITGLHKEFRGNMLKVLQRSMNRPTPLSGDISDYDLSTTWTSHCEVLIDIHSNPVTTDKPLLDLNLSLLGN